MPGEFYVYEHWRPDLGTCFFVGKGLGRRAQRLHDRNQYHRNISAKLKQAGLSVDVRIFKDDLNEQEALALEIDRIAYWRAEGVKLANLTDGGEGVTGHIHSATTRAILSEKSKLQKRGPLSATAKAKIGKATSAALRGRKNPEHSARLKGRKLTTEHRAKITEGLLRRNYACSAETASKISVALLGKKFTETRIENLRISHTGLKASSETRAKMTAAQKRRWAARKACQL